MILGMIAIVRSLQTCCIKVVVRKFGGRRLGSRPPDVFRFLSFRNLDIDHLPQKGIQLGDVERLRNDFGSDPQRGHA